MGKKNERKNKKTGWDKEKEGKEQINEEEKDDLTGPWGRGLIGDEREGRVKRAEVINKMYEEFTEIESEFL